MSIQNDSPPPGSLLEHEADRADPVSDLVPDRAEQLLGEEIDNAVPSRGYHRLPVTGLGGSAGSLRALQNFFANTPAKTGMAFVVVVHLAAESETLMATILQRSTSMPVVRVVGNTKVLPNHVYVIPPGKHLSMLDGHLGLSQLEPVRGKRVAVDLFFRTLADTHGPYSTAIVLSGAEADGSIGIKRIKERGGLTIAQDPDEADHDGMPRAAIATGMVDWVLPVEQIPQRLVEYRLSESKVQLPPEDGPFPPAEQAASHAENESALGDILAFLRMRTGRDFSYYKRATILRRIGRRMQVNGVTTLPAYLVFLRTHAGEAGALLQDLLISVTNFFRDREVFQALEATLPCLFEGKGPADRVRVWVAGCATGEEAYSIAMLLCEHAAKVEAPPQLQVFATDIDEEATDAARTGQYTEAIAADVSEERLRRFFTKEQGFYRVKRDVREVVLFALHDLLKDSPFSRLDLVSCRNLLIYLNRDAQSRAFENFHFALRPEGKLLLGSSESAEDATSLFIPINKKHRIYARRSTARVGLPVPYGPLTLPSLALQARQRIIMMEEGPAAMPPPATRLTSAAPEPPRERCPAISWEELHLKLVERFAPPSLIVNSAYDIVHLSEHGGRFLQLTGGEPSANLLRIVHPMLRIELRTALFRAAHTGTEVNIEVPIEMEGKHVAVHVSVRPANDLAPDFLLVVFEERSGADVSPPSPSEPKSLICHLEHELEHVKRQLQDTVEQYEASAEELKASNEELQAMNEELRSATEELETSREELQSINEELTTVNQQLKSKVEEVSHTNSDLQNLMASTNIATVFLDRELRIKRYTPAAVTLFNMIATDIGRPLSDLRQQLEYDSIAIDAARVLDQLVVSERETRSSDGRWFLARQQPYRTVDDHIAGVVLTFIDITERRKAEESLLAIKAAQDADLAAMAWLQDLGNQLIATSELQALFQQVLDAAIQIQTADFGTLQLWNGHAGRLEIVAQVGFNQNFLTHFASVAKDDETSACGRAWLKRSRVVIQDVMQDDLFEKHRAVASSAGFRSVHSLALCDRSGQPVGVLSTHFREPRMPGEKELRLTDILGRQAADLIGLKLAGEKLRELKERFEHAVEIETVGIIFFRDDGRINYANNAFLRMSGYTSEDLQQEKIFRDTLTPPEWLSDSRRAVAEYETQGRSTAYEREYLRKDGSRWWVLAAATRIRKDEGVEYVIDITERKEAERELKRSREELVISLKETEKAREAAETADRTKECFLAVLSHELRTPLTPILIATQSLLDDPSLADDVKDILTMIERNVLLETHFINDLLDLTHINRGRLEVAREPLDLHHVVRKALEICISDFECKSQTVQVELASDSSMINGDFARLQQVFWNLLKNASKFTPHHRTIRVFSVATPDRIAVSVVDSGIGIDPERISDIFQPFTQANPSIRRQFGGLGLGLAISTAIVDAHEGEITAASDGLEKGTVFTVSLPLVKKI